MDGLTTVLALVLISACGAGGDRAGAPVRLEVLDAEFRCLPLDLMETEGPRRETRRAFFGAFAYDRKAGSESADVYPQASGSAREIGTKPGARAPYAGRDRGRILVPAAFRDGDRIPRRARTALLKKVTDPSLQRRIAQALDQARLFHADGGSVRRAERDIGAKVGGVGAWTQGVRIWVPRESRGLTLRTLAHEIFHVHQFLTIPGYDHAYRSEGLRLYAGELAIGSTTAEARRTAYNLNRFEQNARYFSDTFRMRGL